jgi:hypothetical protein
MLGLQIFILFRIILVHTRRLADLYGLQEIYMYTAPCPCYLQSPFDHSYKNLRSEKEAERNHRGELGLGEEERRKGEEEKERTGGREA